MGAKRRRGRPAGAKNKPKPVVPETPRRKGGGRLREKLEEGLTDKEIMGLSAELKARLLASLQPKEPPVPVGNSFTLLISGLAGPVVCPKCEHPFLVDSRTQQEAPGDTISPAAIQEDDPTRPRIYVASEKALEERAARDARAAGTTEEPEPPVRFTINPDSLDLG